MVNLGVTGRSGDVEKGASVFVGEREGFGEGLRGERLER